MHRGQRGVGGATAGQLGQQPAIKNTVGVGVAHYGLEVSHGVPSFSCFERPA
jgi:hypothetical protein